MSYRFSVFDFLSFLVPGLLLMMPLVFLPSFCALLGIGLSPAVSAEFQNLSSPQILTSVFVFIVAYVLGLLIYHAGRVVEKRILEPGQPHSSRILATAATAALKEPVPEKIRALARKQFDLSGQAGDPQIFSLLFRYLLMVGKAGRAERFLHLRNLTRGATLVFFIWLLCPLVMVFVHGPQLPTLVTLLVTLVLTVAADQVRRGYNRDIAEEVFAAYYIHFCRTESDKKAKTTENEVGEMD